jgi:hypothetical protein
MTKNFCQMLGRLAIYAIFMIPYVISQQINWTSCGWRTVGDYTGLFIGQLGFMLIGYEIYQCLGLYREGDMVNLKKPKKAHSRTVLNSRRTDAINIEEPATNFGARSGEKLPNSHNNR